MELTIAHEGIFVGVGGLLELAVAVRRLAVIRTYVGARHSPKPTNFNLSRPDLLIEPTAPVLV